MNQHSCPQTEGKKSHTRSGMGLLGLMFAISILSSAPAIAQAAPVKPANKATLIVMPFRVNTAKGNAGRSLSANVLTAKLKSALSGTRKFDILERQDLDMIANEIAFSKSEMGNKKLDNAALLTADFIVSGEIGLAEAGTTSRQIPGTERYMRETSGIIIADIKVFDTAQGKVVRACKVEASASSKAPTATYSAGPASDLYMEDLLRTLTENVAVRVTETVFPVKVIQVLAEVVYLNRGEGGGLHVGDSLNICVMGEELVDPDTNESLGATETPIANIRVSEVLPKFSKAVIVSGKGVLKGQIARVPTPEGEGR